MKALDLFLDRVLVVVVIYRTPLSKSRTWQSLSESALAHGSRITILIYDNSPEAQSVDSSVTIYHHDASNPGVSKAYNFGGTLAHRMQKEWLILFDQDTVIPGHAFDAYYTAQSSHPGNDLFAPVLTDQRGIVSPFLFRFGGGSRLSAVEKGPLSLDRYMAMNSGLLVRLSSFLSVGGFDESFPLDFSDMAFINRMRTVTRSIVITADRFEQGFSGTQELTPFEALSRFTIYVNGAKVYATAYGSGFLLFLRTFLRAMRFCLLHRTLRYLPIHYKAWRL